MSDQKPLQHYRVELTDGRVLAYEANFLTVPTGMFGGNERYVLGVVGQGPIATFAADAVKAIYPVADVPEWIRNLEDTQTP